MPRFGSVWLDAVCRVPKLTSFRIVALIRPGSISAAARAGRGRGAGGGGAGAGSVVGQGRTSEQGPDRGNGRGGQERAAGGARGQERRCSPYRGINDGFKQESSHSDWCYAPPVPRACNWRLRYVACRYVASSCALGAVRRGSRAGFPGAQLVPAEPRRCGGVRVPNALLRVGAGR